ncbi:roadblock/LC7 domain-containing protein [Methanoculleus chikugoensis]|uniref:roadblock/LC7 domain-containing protein n=1 Tax=Methanoculleus chikugoensis TaxID=118126 RepID=UPI001FB49F5B|nr:roadblock/LC7 domain-containing protein [Methanoculleus chikugoensis]
MGESARRYIDEIQSVVGVTACALVSSEGRILGKHFPEGDLTSSLFAAMCATVLASAEAACGSVDVERPCLVAVSSADAAILIVSVGGEATLITAVIDKSADLPTVQRQLLDIAARIGEEEA